MGSQDEAVDTDEVTSTTHVDCRQGIMMFHVIYDFYLLHSALSIMHVPCLC